VELIETARELCAAIPILMLAIPNPADRKGRDANIDQINSFIERIDAKLASLK